MKSGEVSEIDIKVGKIIIHAAKQNKELNKITLSKIILTPSGAFLIVEKGDKARFEKSGFVLMNDLSDAIGTDVFIIERANKVNKFIENMIAPIEPISISTVFIPPFGEKEIKVQLKKEDEKRLPINQETISGLTEELFGLKTHYAFT
ncbi:MAG: hypothetical protein D6732_23100 [Methanobacteriota archaeon]|nr:MAG: hypothetical protein D6732_23100 [Euryarchaeota archaeon]